MEFEEALHLIRIFDKGGVWESFVRVEYGEDWMRSGWQAYKDMTSDSWDTMSDQDIVARYVQMVNDEFRQVGL